MPNPPIGLGYLASYMENMGFNVFLIDLSLRNISNEVLSSFIKKKNPILIGISALTAYYPSMIELCKFLKKEISIPIILGGIHPSSLPELSLRESNADYAVIGEGEQTLLEVATILEKCGDPSKIKGLGFMRYDEYIQTPPRELISNLDDIPFPAWHKINPLKYPKEPHGFILKYAKVAPIISTRGCPYNCTYCASCNFWGQKIRFRSPRNVVDEIEYLINKFGIREIHFWDDNLTMKPSHIIGICKEIIKRRLNIALATPNGIRIDSLNNNVLRWMKAAGFHYLLFPVESGSQNVLKSVQKKTDLKVIAKNAFLAKKKGFNLHGIFMIGFPKDTKATIEKTIQFARSLPFDIAGFFVMKPIPGSKIFDEWSKNKDLTNFKWTTLDFHSFKNNVSSLDSPSLKLLFNKAFKAIVLTRFLHTFYYRFILYGNIFQIKLFIKRILFFLLGFDELTLSVQNSIK